MRYFLPLGSVLCSGKILTYSFERKLNITSPELILIPWLSFLTIYFFEGEQDVQIGFNCCDCTNGV